MAEPPARVLATVSGTTSPALGDAMPPADGSPTATMIHTDRGDVQYVTAGSGEPVLVVHGSPGGFDAGWLMAQFLLDAGFQVIVPSRPGYLGTPLSEETASIDAQADLHAALLAALGIQHAAVLCWSGGGPSSYRLAVRHPEVVTSLAALAAVSQKYEWHMGTDEKFMFGTRPGNWLITMMARHRPDELISATLSSEGDLTKEQVAALTEHVSDDPRQREFVLRLAQTVSHRGDRRAGVRNDQDTFGAITSLELAAVQAPTLLVQGDVDTDVPPSYSDYAKSQVPDSRLIVVPQGGHLAAFTGPEAGSVQQEVVSFLRRDH